MFEALTALSYNGALKLLGLRLRPERMQKTALATELENAQTGRGETRSGGGAPRRAARTSDAQALASASEALSAASHFLHSTATPPGSP